MTTARRALAERLGVSDGRLQTTALALALAVGTAVTSLPPALRNSEVVPAASAAESPSAAVAPAAPSAGAPPGSPRPTSRTGRPENDTDTAPEPGQPQAGPGAKAIFARIGAPGAASGIALAPDGHVWAVTDNGERRGGPTTDPVVVRFDPEGREVQRTPIPRSAPAIGLGGVTSTADGDAILTTADEVWRVTRDGAVRRVTEIPDVQPCLPVAGPQPCQPGLVARPPLLRDVTMLDARRALVADDGQSCVWMVDVVSGTVTSWSADLALLGVPEGGPTGLAVLDDGDIIVLTRSSARAGGGSSVYRVEVTNGAAGTVHHLADLPERSTGADVTMLGGGRLAVSVPETGQILVYRLDGTLTATAPDGPPLHDPTGLAPDGSAVLVAAADPANPAESVIVRIAI